MKENIPTPAAMRAAKAIGSTWGKFAEDLNIHYASIIDRETGLPLLIEALKEANSMLSLLGLSRINPTGMKIREALRKAEDGKTAEELAKGL